MVDLIRCPRAVKLVGILLKYGASSEVIGEVNMEDEVQRVAEQDGQKCFRAYW